MGRYLAVNHCPTHGTWSISVDSEHSGTRLTAGKCCGRWNVVARLPMTATELREAAEELQCEAESLDAEMEGPQE